MNFRRKRKVNSVKNSPFPVPIQTLTDVSAKKNYWYYYTAEMKGDYATVSHTGDIKFLYTMGFFGKGMLSRGLPELQKSLPPVHLPTVTGETSVIRTMRRRMYLRHRQWHQDSVAETEPRVPDDDLLEFDSDVEFCPQQEDLEFRDPYTSGGEPGSQVVDATNPHTDAQELEDVVIDNTDTDVHPTSDTWLGRDAEADDDDFLEEPEIPTKAKENKSTMDDWDRMEADTNFWGTEEKADNSGDHTGGSSVKSKETLDDKVNHCGSIDSQRTEETMDNRGDNTPGCYVDNTREDNGDTSVNGSVGVEGKVQSCDKNKNTTDKNEYCDRVSINYLNTSQTAWGKRKIGMTQDTDKDSVVDTSGCQSTEIEHRQDGEVVVSKKLKMEKTAASDEQITDSNMIEPNTGLDFSNRKEDLNKNKDSKTNNTISTVECKKVLSAYEIHRHLEPSCTQPLICDTHDSYNEKDATVIKPNITKWDGQGNNNDQETTGPHQTKINSDSQGDNIHTIDTELNPNNTDTDRVCQKENVDLKTAINDHQKHDITINNTDLKSSTNDCQIDDITAQNTDSILSNSDHQKDDNNTDLQPSKETDHSLDGECNDTCQLPLHPLCVDEDTDGDVLVIDDSDFDDNVANIPIQRKTAWEPVRKNDDYLYNEPLLLSLDETFFLSYGLGCLTVFDETQRALSICDMWQTFCRRRKRFLPCYVTYHYFRSKGWVPKNGITFGVDFILYKEGPPFYHGSYSVMVKTVYEGDYAEVEEYKERQLSWTSLARINRVTEHVAKTLMLCYVIMPRNLTPQELETPKCLNKFKIRLQVMDRWVSSQERDLDKPTEKR